MTVTPFHLAIPVSNLEKCRTFYRDVLNCEEGRSSEKWVDFNFFGHQFVIHQTDTLHKTTPKSNPVDGKNVPVPHFGVVLNWADWKTLASRLKKENVDSLRIILSIVFYSFASSFSKIDSIDK